VIYLNETNLNTGKLYGIGMGPGDEELITLKAMNTIKKCDVIFAPSAREGGESTALSIAKNFISKDKEVIVKHFPMGGKDQKRKIKEASIEIEEKLKLGKNVAFLTIGDPFIYSTYIYVLEYIDANGYSVETIPGITSFSAAASISGETIVIGNERLLIIPASQIEKIRDEKFLVIMKLKKNEREVLDFLEDKGFKYVYVKRAYREGQQVLRDRDEILKNSDYMSLIIAHRD
jgi:precorrin-2/cobalt-factor-2 C20-methyltransferase